MLKRNSITLPHWMQPLVLGGIVLLIYVMTFTNWHSGDDLQLALKVESYTSGEPILHPTLPDTSIAPITSGASKWRQPQVRYLLELPTLARIYRASKIMGWSDNAILPMQVTHSVFGAIGITFFFLALVQFVPRLWGFILSLGLAFSYSWWYYSTHLDYTIASHALSSVLLYLIVLLFHSQSQTTLKKWLVLALGLVNGLISLYLLNGLLLIPMVPLAIFMHYKTKNALYGTGLYLFSLLFTIIFVGGFTWTIEAGLPLSLTSLLRKLSYSEAFSHGFVISDIPKSLYGFTKSLVTYPFLGRQEPHVFLVASGQLNRALYLVWYILAILITVFPFIILLRLLRPLGKYRSLAIILGLWFFIQMPFGIYWEPSYIKWWTGALIPFWGLIGILMIVPSIDFSFLHKARAIVLFSLVLILFSVNFFSYFLPNSMPNSNPWIQTSNILENNSEPDDLFISLRYHPLDFHLPYFARRHTLSFEMISVLEGSDEANKRISQAINATLGRGNHVFVYISKKQNFLELADSPSSSDLHFTPVVFENVLVPDILFYEITIVKP